MNESAPISGSDVGFSQVHPITRRERPKGTNPHSVPQAQSPGRLVTNPETRSTPGSYSPASKCAPLAHSSPAPATASQSPWQYVNDDRISREEASEWIKMEDPKLTFGFSTRSSVAFRTVKSRDAVDIRFRKHFTNSNARQP
jgi:hypothetical protein